MPFKLVCIVEESLSLGSILMTKGVHTISIDTITAHRMKEETPKEEVKLITNNKKKIPEKTKPDRFYHPSGKTAADLAVEFLKEKNIEVTWAELSDHIANQGFNRSSTNNAISRLVKQKRIVRVEQGRYKVSVDNSQE